MPTKPQNHDAAMRRANKAEAKRLRALLRKINRECDKEIRLQKDILRCVERNLEKLKRLTPKKIAKISLATQREETKILRRIAILEGRGL